ncbi:hypothetical protein Patl1_24532 [Pistacia atlantica]|uniref:Uncharacterized protein n=1 Tax=Pistacia atlantica TaxID=434234 RepID=A0ACC0ZZE7_9ROSI|nr:hypothetical protein Patl1_24532 [Pistacia atlantica]
MATGCNSYTTTFKRHQIKSTTRCLPICTCDPAKDKRCYDLMCTISSSHQAFSVPENCTGALMVEQDWLMTNYLGQYQSQCFERKRAFSCSDGIRKIQGNCVEPYKSGKTLFQPKEKDDESGCTGTLFCNITSRNDCPSKCPRGYKYNSSQKVDGRPTCYPAPPKGPGKNKDIPIGLCSAFGTLSLSIGSTAFVRVR